jgi:quercetin dioxygenase-like cupin family protein
MMHVNYKDVKEDILRNEDLKDISVRWLISKRDGAKNFAMRLFEVGPGGYSPYHQHEWEHEMFVLEGEGVARKEGGEVPFKAGDVFFIAPWDWHNFSNTGSGPLKFLCLIPYFEKDKK